MQTLTDLAADLGLTIVEKRIAHASGYRPSDRTIFLTPGMSRRVTRSVLAHEIAHHVLEHRPTPHGPVRWRQERQANEWAARQLISHDAYVEVESLRDGHRASMAHDLDVADELVDAYRGMLQRIGDTVYMKPRMGAGMWERRVMVA